MPSPRVIGKLLVALLLAAAFGHAQNPTIAAHFTRFHTIHTGQYRDQDRKSTTPRSFAAGPSKQKGVTVKRHKRVLISKVFRPETTVIILKKYRLVESLTDYSSPHILQRAVAVSSLRGPPSSGFFI